MHEDHPPNDLRGAVRRTASGAVDTDVYRERARSLHARFLRVMLARAVRRAWRAIRLRLERRAARRELSALSARELKDLDLAGTDLEALVSGAYFTDSTRHAGDRGRRAGQPGAGR